MRKPLGIIPILLLIAAIGAPNASADSITFTDVTTGSGTIGATSFSNVTITVIGTANTASVTTPVPNLYEVADTSTSVSIGGLGTFDFTTPVGFFVNNTGGVSGGVGFQRAGAGDLIDGPINTDFATWALNTSIGPITGSGHFFQWGTPSPAVDTTGGQLILDDGSTSVTFSASVGPVPEPSSFLLLGTGLLLLGLLALATRSKRHAAQAASC